MLSSAERKGRAEGRANEKLATARKMLQMGFDISVIAQVTGLDPDQIGQL